MPADLTPEIWTAPSGQDAELRYLGSGDFEWYPEGPGQRPPACYALVAVATGETVEEHTVFPVEPWNAYDAISDRLVREGWTAPPATEEDLAECEHGLSAWLCSGPNHY